MGHIIEITESKYDHLVENAEKMLRYGGKVMQCLDELCEEDHYGERGRLGRGGYGMRGEERDERGGRYGRGMGMREHEREDWDDDWDRDPYMGERRRRSSRTGRYIRG